MNTSGPIHEEHQYLSLIENIIANGVYRPDRTGTGTRSVFGVQHRWSLSNNSFPLLTTKRVFFRGVLEELIWFVNARTDSNLLSEKNVKIWDGHGSREYLDSIGLTEREQGDLGPVYGFQWRHFGAEYINNQTDYSGQGVDQLANVIHLLKTDPYNRRIIMSAWNPKDLPFMALPPCHMFCQFYVADGTLSCLMYQRSCDVGLGVPFNIASYSLLTIMLAHICDLQLGEFIHSMGDSHVYEDHVEALKTQCTRDPRPFPTLKIKDGIRRETIEEFEFDDFVLEGYDPHAKIAMKMSV